MPARSGGGLLAGVAGAAIALAVGAGAVISGLLPLGGGPDDTTARRLAALESRVAQPAGEPAVRALAERLSAAEATLRRLEQRPADAGASTGTAPGTPVDLDPLIRRITAAEQSLAAVGTLEARIAAAEARANDPQAAARLATIEQSLGELTQRGDRVSRALAETEARADAATAAATDLRRVAEAAAQAPRVTPAEVAPLADRLAAVERGVASLTQRIGAAEARPTADQQAALAVTAAALRDAVIAGLPFQAELAAYRATAGTGAGAAEPLARFAQAGLPTSQALARRFAALEPDILKAMARPAGDGLLDRLAANASHLVRVRPAGEAGGEDPIAVVARIGERLRRGELAAATEDLKKLPGEARAAAGPLIESAEARVAAEALARRLATEAVTALGQR